MQATTTIRANGGSVRYWHNGHGGRAVLCKNGKVLVMGSRSKWLDSGRTVEEIEREPIWQADTRTSLSAAITRTSREARRLSLKVAS
jgi:hypothetical protein